MNCLFLHICALVSFRFNFLLGYWFHRARSWFRNICLTSHHVWVLLQFDKPVSSLDHVGATGAMVRGYEGLEPHGVMGRLEFPVKRCKSMSSKSQIQELCLLLIIAYHFTKRVGSGFLQLQCFVALSCRHVSMCLTPHTLECTEAQCWSSQVQWPEQPTDSSWHSVLSNGWDIFGSKMVLSFKIYWNVLRCFKVQGFQIAKTYDFSLR